MSKKMNNLLLDLKVLLTKYKATIHVGYDDFSDIQGIYGKHIEIFTTKPETFQTEESHIINRWDFDGGDIEVDKETEPTKEELSVMLQETQAELDTLKEKYTRISKAYWAL